MKDKHYYKDGTITEYYDDSKILHRTDGPAIEYANRDKHWYIDGKCHRIDGPAREYANGDKYYYIDGKRHRIDGPAVEHADGDKYYYLDGEGYTEQEYTEIVEETKALPKALRLIDPRAWVREL